MFLKNHISVWSTREDSLFVVGQKRKKKQERSKMASYGNVFFLGVARIVDEAIIVASHSFNTETDLGAVKQVLEQPNMEMSPGKHYSFSVGQLAWHLIAGTMTSVVLSRITFDFF